MNALLITPMTVSEDKAEAFLRIAAKPQGSYAGSERFYLCRGQEVWIDTRYDGDLRALGVLEAAE